MSDQKTIEQRNAEFIATASAEEVLHVVDELLVEHRSEAAIDQAVDLIRAWIDRPSQPS